jgi:hypothetical protein
VLRENTLGAEGRITFTLAGALAGARRCVPVAISGFGIGLVFGTLAGQARALGVRTVLALRTLEAKLL